jgi:hypothetical protein
MATENPTKDKGGLDPSEAARREDERRDRKEGLERHDETAGRRGTSDERQPGTSDLQTPGSRR